jgi:type II secretory pathway component GspD/PulD (secretin)
VADERANVVWLAGAPAEVASYAATAQQMDQMTVADGGDADAPGLRFFALEHARAKPLADTINRMLSAMGIDAPVVADVQSNKLVVFASAGPHEQITTLITNLDVPGKGGPE